MQEERARASRSIFALLVGVSVLMMGGCASQQMFVANRFQASSPKADTAGVATSSTQSSDVLYVAYNDGCNQGSLANCAGSLVAFPLNADGSPGSAGQLTSIENPVSLSADKLHGRLALENWANSINGWYELTAFRAASDGSLTSLGMAPLNNASAMKFDPSGHWLVASPGPTSFWSQVGASSVTTFDLTQAFHPSSSSFALAATDSTFIPNGLLVAVGAGQAMSFSIDSEGELSPGHGSTLSGDFRFALAPQLMVEPLGRWLYVQSEPMQVDVYQIGSDGSLTHTVQSSSGWLFGSDFDPTGKYAFFGSQIYSIDQQDGSLQSPRTYTQNSVIALSLGPSGTALYTIETPAGSSIPAIYGYSFNSATGSLQPITGSPWTLNSSLAHLPWGLEVIRPNSE